ncbi:MAG: thioredoxin [Candidatus Omnitrophica bacterium]|nr:thioredoxin [Candidatus Omnitrophota bacterium]MDD5080108.1 thioredoxin [Candidatus Omnitrophota bacterium]
MALMHFTDGNFTKEVLESDVPVVVDFWATWCGPCKMVAPIIDELAKEYDKKVKIGKVDVDESPNTASKFGVMSIPTIMFFKGGKVMEQSVGAISKSDLKKKIDENI